MKTKVVRNKETEVVKTPWGSMQWLVSAADGSSEHMTLGRVTFKPGQGNPVHSHPNCEEILFVVQGAIEHSLPEGGTVNMEAGDCIVLPQGGIHYAKNIGNEDAVVIVAFNSAHRKMETPDKTGEDA